MLLAAGPASFDVEAVVFDKDGTLISLDSYWREASAVWIGWLTGGDSRLLTAVSETLGWEGGWLVEDGLLATASLDTIEQAAIAVLSDFGMPTTTAASRSRRGRVEAVRLAAMSDPEPIGDVYATFRRLSAAGLRLAIATTDDEAPTRKALHTLGVHQFVDLVIAGDGDVPSKPHPAVISTVASLLRVVPKSILVVGDSTRDRDTAIAGGTAGFVLVAPDGRRRFAADAVIASVDELVLTGPAST
jgi:phosphoglycolate phosphatase